MSETVVTRYKYCIVPLCSSTTIKTPDKLFFSVPKDPSKRLQWCQAMNRDEKNSYKLSNKSTHYCCEDHFTINEDMENYSQFKLMKNVRLKLKPDVIPHIFDCQRAEDVVEKPYPIHLERVNIIEDTLPTHTTSTNAYNFYFYGGRLELNQEAPTCQIQETTVSGQQHKHCDAENSPSRSGMPTNSYSLCSGKRPTLLESGKATPLESNSNQAGNPSTSSAKDEIDCSSFLEVVIKEEPPSPEHEKTPSDVVIQNVSGGVEDLTSDDGASKDGSMPPQEHCEFITSDIKPQTSWCSSSSSLGHENRTVIKIERQDDALENQTTRETSQEHAIENQTISKSVQGHENRTVIKIERQDDALENQTTRETSHDHAIENQTISKSIQGHENRTVIKIERQDDALENQTISKSVQGDAFTKQPISKRRKLDVSKNQTFCKVSQEGASENQTISQSVQAAAFTKQPISKSSKAAVSKNQDFSKINQDGASANQTTRKRRQDDASPVENGPTGKRIFKAEDFPEEESSGFIHDSVDASSSTSAEESIDYNDKVSIAAFFNRIARTVQTFPPHLVEEATVRVIEVISGLERRAKAL